MSLEEGFKVDLVVFWDSLSFEEVVTPSDVPLSRQKWWYIETQLLVEVDDEQEMREIFGEGRELIFNICVH